MARLMALPAPRRNAQNRGRVGVCEGFVKPVCLWLWLGHSEVGVWGNVDYLAIALFVVLFATAENFVGGYIFPWLTHDQEVQLALVASFLFGIISAWRKDG